MLFCCLLYLGHALAQDTVRRLLLYANLKGQFGYLGGGKLSAAAIIGKHHEFGIGYDMYLQHARNTPADFLCWSCRHGPDKDWIAGGTLTYGYVIYSRFLKGFSRIILRTGVLLGAQSIPYQFQSVPNASPVRDNYTYRHDRHFAAAWVVNPSFDVALGRVVGFTLGPYGIVNKDFSGAGISFGAMLGSVAKTRPQERVRHTPKPAE